MYSRILFVAALYGAANAVKLGAHQDELEVDETITLTGDDGAIDTTDQVHTDFIKETHVEGKKDSKKHGEVDYQKTAEVVSGKTGEYTAEDGTTFVSGAIEKDSQSSKKSEDGKVAKQTFSWDPSAGMIRKPAPKPEPEPESDPEIPSEPEPSSESEETETCSEDENCGCCSQDVCPDLTYYDKMIAEQAADFMAHVRAGKAEVTYNLSGKEKEEYEDELTKDMMKDLAGKMVKDPDFVDGIPQKLADMSAIEAMKDAE